VLVGSDFCSVRPVSLLPANFPAPGAGVRADFSHRDFPCSCVRSSVTHSWMPSVQLVSSLGSRSFFHGEQHRRWDLPPFCSRSEASIPACVTAVQIGVDFRGAPPYRGLLPADPRELGTRLSSLSHIFPAVKRAVLA
jgi:hypothetical protein